VDFSRHRPHHWLRPSESPGGRRRPARAATRIRRGATAALTCGALLATALFTVSCSSGAETTVATTTVAQPSSTAAPNLTVALPGTLAGDFSGLAPTLGGRAGMAIMAVGGDQPAVMGNWTEGPAWSTMKVPLTLAVLHSNGDNATYQMTAAITESDNSAADGLWQSLGAPGAAAQAVQQVLRDGGDAVTTVPATKSRSEYSAFGQADWSLANQVMFASRLPCLPDAGTVTGLMGKVVGGQQWGLGQLDNSVYKGGWGPDPSGNYLVRQFGLITTSAGQIAVALAAQADSGSFADGTQILDKMANLVAKHLEDLPAGHCPGR
jgi:hypothetical protein